VDAFLAVSFNSEPVKYAIVALAAPLWIPFARALWHTLNDSLREEGGLLGRPPTEEELAELEKRFGPASASLISVPKEGAVRPRDPRATRRGSAQAAPGSAASAAPRRGGFRS
jgi:hypothetical protein